MYIIIRAGYDGETDKTDKKSVFCGSVDAYYLKVKSPTCVLTQITITLNYII